MPADTKPNFDVQVKFKAGTPPKIDIQDTNGNKIGKLDVTTDSTITFTAANGSDPFYFVGFYVQTTPITTCPAPGSSPALPSGFTATLQPMQQATQMVVDDADTGEAGSTTTYHYAVQISTRDANPTYYWSDPEIVNHVEAPTETPAVRLPDDMPAVSPTFGRAASATDLSAPPPSP